MSSKQILSYYAADDAGTNQLGSILGAHLKPGHIILLEGGLGAGKSALARAIIRSVLKDHTLQIPSPTFLLVLPYQHGETSFL
ncbi:MAG TPA: bifunctional tRNA (adenosine(37)-N6)-threonylcarbamoyltransferase complex ATPase subunit type 1 TsaE/phosphotransferase, partial [Devosia sp.]|nr:bifunctional tRNA (adenosine(37)-N6)-threonylcarbamoyltransferase complex ATPase subunit type 1 TsaE/phosphotransferase [Devosia sp.]